MKRLLSLICVTFACSCAFAQTFEQYLSLRRHYRITQACGVEALETMVGSRIVEITGTVKGTVTVSTGTPCILLEKSDGDTMFVTCQSQPADWLSGNELPVRMIVKANRATAESELSATLLAAAPEAEIATLEARSDRSRELTSRHAGSRADREVVFSRDAATPIYANFIRHRNRRLSDSEATKIAGEIIGYSVKYGVDARLIMAMVMVESGFNPYAVSRTGAMGLGQLMPGTAAGLGVSNAYDSYQNLSGTVRLIRSHFDSYSRAGGGSRDDIANIALALAAYNAGPGAVRKYGGIPPYRETRNYVRKVISIWNALRGVSSS